MLPAGTQLFHLDESLISVPDLLSFFYHRLPRGFSFPGERHSCWHAVYVVKGQVSIKTDTDLRILNDGNITFHAPGEFHTLKAEKDQPADTIIFSFVCVNPAMNAFQGKTLTLDMVQRTCLAEALDVAERMFFNHTSTMSSFMQHRPNVPVGTGQMLRLLLERFLLLLYQQPSVRPVFGEESSFQSRQKRDMESCIKEYLLTHIDKKLTLEQIADAFNCSASQIKKEFHRATGRGVIDYFIQIKMDEATRLLREGSLNVSQVAARLGYDNTRYFSRLFKKRSGFTPQEFAKKGWQFPTNHNG